MFLRGREGSPDSSHKMQRNPVLMAALRMGSGQTIVIVVLAVNFMVRFKPMFL